MLFFVFIWSMFENVINSLYICSSSWQIVCRKVHCLDRWLQILQYDVSFSELRGHSAHACDITLPDRGHSAHACDSTLPDLSQWNSLAPPASGATRPAVACSEYVYTWMVKSDMDDTQKQRGGFAFLSRRELTTFQYQWQWMTALKLSESEWKPVHHFKKFLIFTSSALSLPCFHHTACHCIKAMTNLGAKHIIFSGSQSLLKAGSSRMPDSSCLFHASIWWILEHSSCSRIWLAGLAMECRVHVTKAHIRVLFFNCKPIVCFSICDRYLYSNSSNEVNSKMWLWSTLWLKYTSVSQDTKYVSSGK